MMRCICVLANIRGVLSTEVEIYFVSSLSWEEFGQHMLKWTLCVLAVLEGVWSSHVAMYILSAIAWDGLRYVLFAQRLWIIMVNIFWGAFCVFASIRCIRSKQLHMHFVSWLAWEGLWSPHVEMHFVFSLACVEFGQH